MKKFEEVFYKKTNQVKIRFLSLYNLKNENNLDKMLKIIKLFKLDDMYLIGKGFVKQESIFLTEPQIIDDSIKVIIKKEKKRLFSKNMSYNIDVVFSGRCLAEIVKLIAKEDITLFITPNDQKNILSQVELLLNDNEFSSITFSTNKYNYNEIISEIKLILG